MGISGGWRAVRAGGEDSAYGGTTRRRRVVGLGVAAAIVAGGGVLPAGATSAAALPRLSVADVVLGESAGLVQFRISLSAIATSPVQVRVRTSSGSANLNDYQHLDAIVTIPAGQRSTTVPLEITDDLIVEGLETVRLNLSTEVNATIANGLATVSIVDNDTAVAVPRIFARPVIVDEKAGTAGVPVVLGAPGGQASNQAVSVHYATANGIATAGHDFTNRSGTLTFAPGETVKVVPVAITDDPTNEPAETFRVVLSSPTHATLGAATANVTIGASDRARVALPAISVADTIVGENVGWIDLAVTLNAPSQLPVGVRVRTSSGSANLNDYEHIDAVVTFAPGQTTRPFRIHITDDLVTEGLETLRLDLSTATNATIANGLATVSIVDNDTAAASPRIFARPVIVDEKVGTAFVPVLLGGPAGRASNRTVTVHYATANGTATVRGHDYLAARGTLSFAPGETVKLIPVLVTDDTVNERAERFRVVLSAPTSATIGAATANVTIGASDRPRAALPAISVADATVGENVGWIDLAVTLDAPSRLPVGVRVRTSSSSANLNDYEHIDSVVTFAPGQTTRPFRIHITDDLVTEGLETLRLDLSTATNATIARSQGTVAITAND